MARPRSNTHRLDPRRQFRLRDQDDLNLFIIRLFLTRDGEMAPSATDAVRHALQLAAYATGALFRDAPPPAYPLRAVALRRVAEGQAQASLSNSPSATLTATTQPTHPAGGCRGA